MGQFAVAEGTFYGKSDQVWSIALHSEILENMLGIKSCLLLGLLL